MNLALGMMGWVLAAVGWTVAILALFLAIRFRADWSDIWHTAWLLRQGRGWVVPGEVQDALTSKLAPQRRERMPRREPDRVDPASIPLSDPIMRSIAQSSEEWHQTEMAETARQMLAGGASEDEVLNKLKEMLEE